MITLGSIFYTQAFCQKISSDLCPNISLRLTLTLVAIGLLTWWVRLRVLTNPTKGKCLIDNLLPPKEGKPQFKSLLWIGLRIPGSRHHLGKTHSKASVILPGEAKTSGGKGAGAKEVRNEPLEIQRAMGKARGPSSHKHYDRGVQINIQVNARTSLPTSSIINSVPKDNRKFKGLHPTMARKGHHSRNIRTNSFVFFLLCITC